MRSITIILALTFLLSCRQNPTDNLPKSNSAITDIARDTLLIYRCAPNGTADIKLTLWTDNTFDFYMQTIPQPMTEDEETTVNSSGIWKENNNMTRLTFIKNSPYVSAVFDSSLAKREEFTVYSDSVVEINSKLESISIWGIRCDKTEK